MGAGNINPNAFREVKRAIDKGIIVVISSCVPFGGCHPIYKGAGGGATLADARAILAQVPDARKARILLMLSLATFGNDRTKVQNIFTNWLGPTDKS
jgi:L-asparaginase